jgi:hypothetical protein
MARRRGSQADKAKALDKGLKTMFRNLEQRPVPEPIRSAVDQLDEAARKPGEPPAGES